MSWKCHICARWDAPDRQLDPPYFGYLCSPCSPIHIYPSTVHLKLHVQSRPRGLTPLFALEPTDHPLARDQREGISIARWHDMVHELMHPPTRGAM